MFSGLEHLTIIFLGFIPNLDKRVKIREVLIVVIGVSLHDELILSPLSDVISMLFQVIQVVVSFVLLLDKVGKFQGTVQFFCESEGK